MEACRQVLFYSKEGGLYSMECGLYIKVGWLYRRVKLFYSMEGQLNLREG